MSTWVPLRVAGEKFVPGMTIDSPKNVSTSKVQSFAGVQAANWKPIVMSGQCM